MPFSPRAIAAVLALFVCTGFGAPERLEYTLTPLMENGALTAVQIDLNFRGDADGETTLRLPSSWGGRDELWRSIEGVTTVSGAQVRDGDGPTSRVLTHRPNARIHLRYRVIQDFEGPPNAQQENAYRPVVQPSYFHFIGNAILVTPDERDSATPVRFRTRNMPRGWRFASDLEHNGLLLGAAGSSVIVGGDFRIVRASDPNIRVAIRGAWNFSDADFATQVDGIISAQRAFWGDQSTPYLVTVIPLEAPNSGWLSVGGTGLDDAFAFFATTNAEAAIITRTLAHEGSHTWIPGQIGGMVEEDQAGGYWFSEGFTDFYTGRLLVRQGVWSPQDFAADLNRMLAAYAQSPVRAAPNSRIVSDFWNAREVQQLPYQRGRFLATVWDARLRAQGRDLDDVMLEMRARARGGDPLHADQIFPLIIDRFGVNVDADIANHVVEGAPVLLPEDVFAPCGRVVTRAAARFHRGFDIEATSANNNIVAGVDPNLPAYVAGVRDGMVLIRRASGEIGNADQEITYVMRDGDTERSFSYMPRGHGTYTLQEFVVEDGLGGAQLAQCVAVLSGA
ncbi:MAG TPA: hypothetical protein VM915_09070 [Verrucomicrobiae bacterium]|nr:hypothetical protein [Verrucomicrobiae bacterium]